MTNAEDPAQFANTDRSKRRPVSLRGFVSLPDGSSESALILDLSYEGCAIQTVLPLAAGQNVSLSLLRRGAIDAEVRWAADGKAGLVFKAEQPPATKPHQPRGAERLSLDADVTVRRLGKAKYRVRVLDLSPVGCKIDLIDRPALGEAMMVKFDGLEIVEAEVCWVEDFVAGLRFTRAFHPLVFELLAARLHG